MIFNYRKHLKKFSQENRKHQTESEWKFWNLVLKKDMTWYRFLRQKPIWNYILDFYCDKLKLWIEIDDRSHDWKWEEDEKRTEYLNSLWITIIRYTNEDINYRLNEVMLDLEYKLKERNIEIQKSPSLRPPS